MVHIVMHMLQRLYVFWREMVFCWSNGTFTQHMKKLRSLGQFKLQNENRFDIVSTDLK